jgi:hypothetical protein
MSITTDIIIYFHSNQTSNAYRFHQQGDDLMMNETGASETPVSFYKVHGVTSHLHGLYCPKRTENKLAQQLKWQTVT